MSKLKVVGCLVVAVLTIGGVCVYVHATPNCDIKSVVALGLAFVLFCTHAISGE